MIDELLTACRFYANPENYRNQLPAPFSIPEIMRDNGERMRLILEKMETKNEG